MSTEITVAFVQQYGANVFHLSQQKGSRLQMCVRNETQTGKSRFFDRIGAVTAQKKTSRHSDTPQLDTPHSRRMVTLSDYIWADLVDEEDKIRMLNDPASEYVQAAVWALGRSKDDELILAATGNAYSGENGTTAVALPSAQKFHAHSGGALTTANVDFLRQAKKKFDDNDIDEDVPRYCAITSNQLYSLLSQTEITSSDYAAVKALVKGEIDTFMGFKFIRTQRLAVEAAATAFNVTTGEYDAGGTSADNSRICLFWTQPGLLLSTAKEVTARITERSDKNYAVQAFASMGVGATRMEDVQVVAGWAKDS